MGRSSSKTVEARGHLDNQLGKLLEGEFVFAFRDQYRTGKVIHLTQIIIILACFLECVLSLIIFLACKMLLSLSSLPQSINVGHIHWRRKLVVLQSLGHVL